jgi:hypothetical protein
MPRLEFVGQSARDVDFPTGGTSRLVNGFREPMVPGGRAQHVLRAVPGMLDFAELPTVFGRAMTVWNGLLAVVAGTNLWTITSAGGVANIGTVEADGVDPVSIDQSTGVLCVGSNLKYWTWNGTTLANPTTGAVTSVGGITYLGGYVIASQQGGRVFAWSNLATPGTFSGLDFASAEITPEPIIRPIAFKDALYLFKASGYERWGLTGLSGPRAFARIEGAQGEPGLKAFDLITTLPNGLSWVGNDGRVHVLGLGPISTPPLEVAIEKASPKRMFFYELRGHGFICLTFSAGSAWCYDVATGEWHERLENEGPWTASAAVKFGADWYVATDAAKIARLGASCTDFGMPMVRRYVSNTLEMDDRFVLDKIEAFPRPAGDDQGDGTPAKVTLRTSRDAGMTWSADKDRHVGVVGDYDARLVWRGLGQFRRATVELSQTGPVDVPLMASVDVGLA